MGSRKFDKPYTQIVKAIAVLLLLAHHLFGIKYTLPIKQIDFHQIIICLTKVCVSLFTILSGYGITRSYEKNNMSNLRFVFVHIKRLLINYWYIYIPVFILSFFMHINGTPSIIYGQGKVGITNFLLDFLGMKTLFNTPTLNQTWWYMEVTIICYLFYPIFYKGIKKSKALSLIISIIPCALADIIGYKTGFRCTERAIFYIFHFILGMILAKNNILDNVVNYCNKSILNRMQMTLISILGIMLFSILSTQFTFIPHVFFALSIILLIISIKKAENKFYYILEFLGKHSMNIFLIHSFIYYYFNKFSYILYSLKHGIIKYIALLGISLSISIIIESIKKYNQRFLKAEKYKN